MYGISEYLMVMHEVQKARMADRSWEVGAQPGERDGVIRHDKRVPEVKARFGLEACNDAGSKRATQ